MKALKFLSVLSLVVGLFIAASSTANALQLKSAQVTLSEPRYQTSTQHTFRFTHNQASTLKEIQMIYCQDPSGTCEYPTDLITTTATKGTTLTGIGTDANWTISAGSAGTIKLQETTGDGFGVAADGVIRLDIASLTNHSVNGCQADGDLSSETCYIRIYTCTEVGVNCAPAGSAKVDEAIVSYTAVQAVTVTARIDPTFTFTVSAVDSNVINNQITTSVSSTYSTLPFGNLTAGAPKYAAHRLNVTTNTTGGYTVSMKMQTQLTGVYTANNVDPFAGGSAGATDPKGWTEPTGSTPNTDTGWIGFNTTDADVHANWSGANQLFGPVNSTANIVMLDADSDNGTTGVYVTYAIEANTFQPADTYTGTLVYNALPTY